MPSSAGAKVPNHPRSRFQFLRTTGAKAGQPGRQIPARQDLRLQPELTKLRSRLFFPVEAEEHRAIRHPKDAQVKFGRDDDTCHGTQIRELLNILEWYVAIPAPYESGGVVATGRHVPGAHMMWDQAVQRGS